MDPRDLDDSSMNLANRKPKLRRCSARAGGARASIALLGVEFAHIRDAEFVVADVLLLVRNCGVDLVVCFFLYVVYLVRALVLLERNVVS